MRFYFTHFSQEDQEGARNKRRGLRAVSFPRRTERFWLGVMWFTAGVMEWLSGSVPLRSYSFPFECLSSGRLGTRGPSRFLFSSRDIGNQLYFPNIFASKAYLPCLSVCVNYVLKSPSWPTKFKTEEYWIGFGKAKCQQAPIKVQGFFSCILLS